MSELNVWPPFNLRDLVNTREGEYLMQYHVTHEGKTHIGVCIAQDNSIGPLLMVGETAQRIIWQRMATGDADQIIRHYMGLTPTNSHDPTSSPLAPHYRLDGQIIRAQRVHDNQPILPMSQPQHINPTVRKDTTMPANTNISPQQERWPRVKFPNAFVRPFTHTAKDGKQWDMFAITIPKNTIVNGIDLGGWRFDTFQNRYSQADKANGRDVTISFRPDQPVNLYKGAGEARQTMRIDNAWDICKAVKASNDAYHAARQHNQNEQPPEQSNTTEPQLGADAGVDIMNGDIGFMVDPADPLAMSSETDTTSMVR